MKDNLHVLTEKPKNKHTVFVETKEEEEEFDPVEYFQTIPEAVDRVYNRPKVQDLQSNEIFTNDVKLKKIEKERNKSYSEVVSRIEREGKMKVALDRMQVQKNLMGKGRRTKIKDETDDAPPVYVWSRERKK
eukprot:TRINITY_DN13027_c0_g1_i1.p1 TRINITY_DN13027_c0_g1~~TRINITY_DN13027_c0_g1_i1.p1  ORF type:complete len:149 (-),score=57.79 TRINITY_DN13027_c0_g1_i1:10-405(-)